MFKNGVCPVCGRTAGLSCHNCGLKAIPFFSAVHTGSGELALAYVALQRPRDPGAEREVAFLRYASAVREWFRAQIGVLGDTLRAKRSGDPKTLMPIESDLYAMGSKDPFLHAELMKITTEEIQGAIGRLTAFADRADCRLGGPPPNAPALEPTDQELLLAALSRAGIKSSADLERVMGTGAKAVLPAPRPQRHGQEPPGAHPSPPSAAGPAASSEAGPSGA